MSICFSWKWLLCNWLNSFFGETWKTNPSMRTCLISVLGWLVFNHPFCSWWFQTVSFETSCLDHIPCLSWFISGIGMFTIPFVSIQPSPRTDIWNGVSWISTDMKTFSCLCFCCFTFFPWFLSKIICLRFLWYFPWPYLCFSILETAPSAQCGVGWPTWVSCSCWSIFYWFYPFTNTMVCVDDFLSSA